MLYITLKTSKNNPNFTYLALCYEKCVVSFEPRTIARIAQRPLKEVREYIETYGDLVIERR